MINKQERLSFNADCSGALDLLEHVHQSIILTENVQLEGHTDEDINMLISVFNNPILRSIVNVDDSLSELNQQLQQHPSILPVDLFVNESGELSLNVVPGDDLYDSRYTGKFNARSEFDDQTVPVAKLSNSSSTDTSTSPQLGTPGTTNGTLPPITTQTYAIEFQKAIEEASRGREVINVQLYKPEGSSLGFSVVGLRSEEKGELGIFVQDIQSSGIAGRDGNLREGDQILAIDGQPLDSNISHHQAISILQKARGSVELIVARGAEEETQEIPSPVARSPSAVSDSSKAGSDMVLNTEWSQVEVIDLVNDGSGLGFGIIGGRSTGVVVKTILPGGVADRDGRLQSGDHILQIGDVNLRGMGSEQVAAVLRQSGSHVRLVVARPVEPTSPDYKALGSHAPIVPTKILGDPDELDRHLLQNGYTEALTRQTSDFEAYNENLLFREHQQDVTLHPPATLVRDAVRNPVGASVPLLTAPSLSVLTMDMLPLETSELPEMEKFTVELKKDLHGLGITIAGYVCEKEELSGIFVKSISEGSAADLCKQIQVNDRIVEVDGCSLQGYTNHQAVEVLRSTGQIVKLCLERYLRGPKFEQLQQAIAASELKLPTQSSSAVSLPRLAISTDDESVGEVREESRSTLGLEKVEATNVNVDIRDLEMLIDDDYEGPLKPTVEAAIQAKWNKILGSDMEIIVAQLSKLSEGGGLGISLEGTVDVEHGLEVRPHHYIRSILPEGPVGRNGRLRSGDELLEVNGYRLLGMNHIEVVSILKDLAMSVRMVCARRNDNQSSPKIPEDPHDKAAFAAKNILGGSLQNLMPATDRLVKAKSDGSLASTTITATATDGSFSKMKSRSLEPLTGLAMWSSEPQIIELVKGERGLGFSILDYQDPMNPNETVIVIRSLVPGGVAQIDGQLIPGDRLVFVNDINLENASLDQAVQALKGAPKGIVRIGVAKPLPIPDSMSYCQKGSGENSHSLTIDDQSMYSSCESLSPHPNDEIGEEKKSNQEKERERRKGRNKSEKIESEKSDRGHFETEVLDSSKQFHTVGGGHEEDLSADLLHQMVPVAMDRAPDHRTPSVGDTTDDDLDDEEFQAAWASDVIHLPTSIEVEIRVHKGTEPLGISVDSIDRGVNGMLVVLVVPGGAVARDGHIHPGDYLVSVNNETLRKVTNSQARAILRRAQLLSSDISVTYIPEEAAAAYRKSIRQDSLSSVESSPVAAIRRTSPRSPYFPSDSSVESSDERDKDRHAETKQLLGTPPPSFDGSITSEPLGDFQATSAVVKDESGKAPPVPCPAGGIIPLKDPMLNVSRSFTLKYESLPCTELPTDRAPRQIGPFSVRKLSQTRSTDAEGQQGGPLSICVVDGLYSVHSPKGNKVLVGIELTRKEKHSTDVARVKDKKVAPSSPPRKKDDKTGREGDSSDGSEWAKSKDFGRSSQDGLGSKVGNAGRMPPTRGGSLDVKIQNDFLGKKGDQTGVRIHRGSLVETLCSATKLGFVDAVETKNGGIESLLCGVNEKSAEEVEREGSEFNVVQCSTDGVEGVCLVSGGKDVSDVEKMTKMTPKNVEEPLEGSSSESQDLKSKRKVIQTRIPSFECTCEGALEDVSPEQMCTCASPSGPVDAFLDVYSDTSKRSSHYQSVENAIVHTSEPASNQTSQELTANQELANTESIFSSGEEFKSGGTSPFYSPRGDSPEVVPSSKSSVKMDKEVSANILLAKHWGPERQVEVVREPNCSLGISIVGGKVDLYNAGPDSSSAILGIFIKNVLPNSPAGITNQLKTGDRILEVDSIDLRSASHEKAVEVIRGAGTNVKFLVQSLIQWNVENTSEPASSSTLPPNESEPDPSSQLSIDTPESALMQEGMTDIEIMHGRKKRSINREQAVSDIKYGESIKGSIGQEGIGHNDFDVEVDDDEEDDNIGEHIYDDSNYDNNADDDDDDDEDEGEVNVDDIDIELGIGDDDDDDDVDDDEDDDRAKVEEDEEESDDHAALEVDEEMAEYCFVEDEEVPIQEVETSMDGSDDTVKGINGKKAVDKSQMNADEFGYNLSKVKKKYECLGDTVLIVNLERTHKGLGISLAGHKDRNRMAVFVCGLNPNGSAFKSGAIEVGDEILEVNGIVLRGRCHLNASAIIKGLPGPCFKVVILRRASALQDLAVKPITQFPVSLDDEAPDQKYARFRGVRTVTIRKGNQNLGIMIIEGKHAEVGQGIFISDIQRGSSAEQAGLTIGDMILAVNKDTLLGTNYDAAATLLKKTEGLVTLVVCNPNKGKVEERTGTRPMETRSSTPSRSPITSTKEPEKSRLISFSGLKPLKSTSPSKQMVESPSSSSNESRLSNSKLTVSSPSLVPGMALTPKTSPSLNLRKSSSGKLTEDFGPDPAICPIEPGKEVVIEINKEKLALGLSVIGGCDTVMRVPVVHEIYPESAAAKDGRLQPGDQILEANSEDLSLVTHARAQTILRQCGKVKMLVYRDENITKENLLQTMEVELTKKSGKGLGLSITAKKDGTRVFISEIVRGGMAELDGRLLKGDYILEVNGISLKNVAPETAAAILKSSSGKVLLKIGRIRCKRLCDSSNGRNSLLSSVTDINGSSVEVKGVGDADMEPGFVNGCFHTPRTSTLRNFVRNLSMRRRNDLGGRGEAGEGRRRRGVEKSSATVEQPPCRPTSARASEGS